MTDHELFLTRIALVQAWLQRHGHDALLLNRTDNFAMTTGGKRNYVNRFSDMGAAGILVSRDGKAHFVGNNIEATRVAEEELGSWVETYAEFPWHAPAIADTVKKLCPGDVVSDDGSVGKNVNAELAVLRALLTTRECDKYREIGRRVAEAMTATAQRITRGMLEADIAALLRGEAARLHLGLPVCLVAADDRIARFRHPLPTEPGLFGESATAVERYVMLVGTFVRDGLYVSMTRFVAVADIPDDIHDALNRIAAVDILLTESARPGATMADCFETVQSAYPRCGFVADEWKNHHQGGATGYAGRTSKALPGNTFPCLDASYLIEVSRLMGEEIAFGAAYAWNPSAPGVKSEDTVLLLPDGRLENLTASPVFPEADTAQHLARTSTLTKAGILVH